MKRTRTRQGLKREVEGAPQAGWRANMSAASPSIARKHSIYPAGRQGMVKVFLGMGVLLPEDKQVWAVPALGCSWQNETALFQAVIGKRNTADLIDSWTDMISLPGVGTVRCAKYYGEFAVVMCDVPGCRNYQDWHYATDRFALKEQHVAEETRGDGYRLSIVWDGEQWAPQVVLDDRYPNKPMSLAQATNLVNDLQFMLGDLAAYNRREVAA